MRRSIVYLLLLCSCSLASDQPSRICVATLVSKVEPDYPVAAKKRGIHGAVRLDLVVGKEGQVLSATPISGDPLLVGAAKGAVMQWIYKPTLLNGQPIVVVFEVCVPFVLPSSKHKISPCARNRVVCG